MAPSWTSDVYWQTANWHKENEKLALNLPACPRSTTVFLQHGSVGRDAVSANKQKLVLVVAVVFRLLLEYENGNAFVSQDESLTDPSQSVKINRI